jgi:hypothetical protein
MNCDPPKNKNKPTDTAKNVFIGVDEPLNIVLPNTINPNPAATIIML